MRKGRTVPVNIAGLDRECALQRARNIYGSKNQILVCMEELNELACVLAKYPRYENEDQARQALHDKALDELADVYIILEHIKSILCISNTDIEQQALKKLNRLDRWLGNSDSMQETVDDRKINDETCGSIIGSGTQAPKKRECSTCIRRNMDKDANTLCNICISQEAIDGFRPYYKEDTGEVTV